MDVAEVGTRIVEADEGESVVISRAERNAARLFRARARYAGLEMALVEPLLASSIVAELAVAVIDYSPEFGETERLEVVGLLRESLGLLGERG